jgi:hypothetical protein
MAMFYNFGMEFDAQGNEKPCPGCWECEPSLMRQRQEQRQLEAQQRILDVCCCPDWTYHEGNCKFENLQTP